MEIERIEPIVLGKQEAQCFAMLAAEDRLKIKVVNAKSLGGGSFGRAFDLTLEDGRHIVVKLFRAKKMLAKEVYDLNLLKTHSNIKVPSVIFTREADERVPADCYGMEKLEGKTAFMAVGMLFLSKKKRLAFAEKVTAELHEIHQHKNKLFGDTQDPKYQTWVDCYRPFASDVLAKSEELFANGKLSIKIMSAMRAAWEKFDVIFSEEAQDACLIHGDLNVGNIMVDKKHRITGFIDPLNSMYADREYDLFQFNNMTGKRFYLCKTYLKNYGASKYCSQKLAFYGLWNEVFCFIKAGTLFPMIMNPLVKNMRKQLAHI